MLAARAYASRVPGGVHFPKLERVHALTWLEDFLLELTPNPLSNKGRARLGLRLGFQA